MKNSNKKDVKKLMLLGLAGGLVLGSQSLSAHNDEAGQYASNHYLAAGGCGKGKCGGGTQTRGQGTTTQQGEQSQWADNGSPNGENGYMNGMHTPLSETDLLDQLSSEGKAMYQSLDAEGKALALKLANQGCKGMNECKGMNSCKNSEHSCAGLGSCKGKSNCSFKDKNMAVKVASMKMAQKRAATMNQTNH